MLQVTRHFYPLTRSRKCIFSHHTMFCKVFYCDKKNIQKNLEEVTKSKSSTLPKETPTAKTEVIEALAFANEEEILQTVITEKEKDANVRSRLSKECSALLDKKMRLTSSGLNLRLEQDVAKNTCWEDYMFDKTVDNLKKHSEAPIAASKGKEESISLQAGTNEQGSDGDGHKKSTNRIVRRNPGKVLFAFIPIEWFEFFIPKTGVTGFGTFLFTFGIFLISKEYYVLEHNFYNGLGAFFVWWGAIKYVGPHVAKYLDNEIDEYEKGWQKGRDQTRQILQEQIEDEKLVQFQVEGQLMLIEAKRENVHLQLEEEFRLRQMMVYREVLKRLNYHVAVAKVHQRILHKNLVEYVMREVRKSITPEMEKELINVSIGNLVQELEKK